MADEEGTPSLDELFQPLNFANFEGYPHDVPKRVIDKLPTFQGNNVCIY
jgi:hypothetical protein